ncbi:MAG TPA: MFS transporter [Candidatus Nitrosotenuis sp.]|nr:MFS transporter [Candidatus Nitrosotenuis sp.]
MNSLRREQILITTAGFLRSLGVGLAGVLLALHLHALGWGARETGFVVSAGLAGNACATLLVSLLADRAGRRRFLILLSVLNIFGGLSLAWLEAFRSTPQLLLAAAFVGLVNGLGRDRGPAYALDQAMLPQTTTDEKRTFLIAWYSLFMDAALALGALGAGIPFLLRREFAMDALRSYQMAWFAYVALAALTLLCYAALSARVEVQRNPAAPPKILPPPEDRRTIFKLAALTGMDSLGGGFLSSALLSFWFFTRFEISELWLGPLFAGARVLNGISHLVAAWLSRRLGLLNTMVFTHIPSSLFLICVPFAPTFGWAVILILALEGLVEMDVPTRQSYILAVVRPEARSFASGLTTVTRNISYATGPALAGWAMQALSVSSPLYLGGGIKILYDLLLLAAFRHVKPPEERGQEEKTA